MEQQITIQDLLSGKMYLEPSAATGEEISGPSSRPCATSARKEGFLFLCLKAGNGETPDASWEMAGALPGVSMTLSIGPGPLSGGEGSTLSQILDLNAPEKYCLSPRACQGILNRAQRRGKELPDMLRDALMEVISSSGVTDAEDVQ